MIYLLLIFITIPLALIWQNNMITDSVKTLSVGSFSLRIRSNVFAFAAFLPLYIIYASQYSVHSDYDNYQILYSLASVGRQSVRDPAFLLIFKLLTYFGLPFQSVYFVTYFIAFLLLCRCIQDYSIDFSMSLTLFITVFFMLGFYYIRQLVAVTIIFYAYRYIIGNNFYKYLFLVILASAFHTSALVMLPAYFLLHFHHRTSFYLILSGICAVLNALKDTVLTWLVAKFIPQYFGRHEMFRSFDFDLYDTIWILILVSLTLFYICSKTLPSLQNNVSYPSEYKIRSKFKSETYNRYCLSTSLFQNKKIQPQLEAVFIRALMLYFILFFLGRWIFEFERFGFYLYFPAICLYSRFIDKLSQLSRENHLRELLNISTYILLIVLFFLKYHSDLVWTYRSTLF